MDGFGKRLVESREKKGYNQKAFAESLGITSTRLNYWEKDKREPDLLMLKKIVEALDVDPDYLLGLSDTPKRVQAPSGYYRLDDNDKAEIRGEIKQMLKADKYTGKTIADDIAATLEAASKALNRVTSTK